MAVVRIDSRKINDWTSFHSVCKQAFGFPSFYGMNLNAFIDCLTYIDEDDGMSNIIVETDETLQIELLSSHDLKTRQPNIFEGFIDAIEAVNRRFVENGKNRENCGLEAMNWVYLAIAGVLEIAWAIGLKYTEGWTRFVPSLITGALMIASFYFLSQAVKTLPIGTAYAVWTGIGTVGAAILGMVLFDEPRDIVRVLCIALIIAGIAGLKLTSPV